MDIYDILFQLLILALSVGATWYFSKVYHKKSVKTHSLVATLNTTGNLIPTETGIANDLRVSYKEKVLKNLLLYQFLIVNEGTESLKNIISPLTLHIPSHLKLLKTEIANIEPEGRVITIAPTNEEHKVIVNIDLLNKGEGFVLELFATKINSEITDTDITNTKDKKDDFYFTITAENLPPILKIKNDTLLGYFSEDLYDSLKPISNFLFAFVKWFYVFLQIGGVFLLALIVLVGYEIPKYNPLNFKQFLTNFNIGSLLILASIILTVPMLIFSVLGFFELFKRKEKIKIPFEKEHYKKFEKLIKKW